MIVVGIIAIIATIAVPSYKSYVAKARQQEGFGLLSSYHLAARTTRAEFGYFPGNFVQTGFQPTGELTYRVMSQDGTTADMLDKSGNPYNDDGCVSTAPGVPCNCGGTCVDFKTWSELPDAVAGGGKMVGVAYPDSGKACTNLGGAPFTSNTQFVVMAAAWINPGAAQYDRIAMNHAKEMEVCQDGLK